MKINRKNSQFLIIVTGALLLAIIGYLFYQNSQLRQQLTFPSLTVIPEVVQLAREDLAKNFETATTNITVVSITEVEWSDSSLGCPKPREYYLQVITPGYEAVFDYKGTKYTYHTNKIKIFKQCE